MAKKKTMKSTTAKRALKRGKAKKKIVKKKGAIGRKQLLKKKSSTKKKFAIKKNAVAKVNAKKRPKITLAQKKEKDSQRKFEVKANRLLAKGRERGFVTYDEILKEFPAIEEDIMFLE